jgi:hypothetical protein
MKHEIHAGGVKHRDRHEKYVIPAQAGIDGRGHGHAEIHLVRHENSLRKPRCAARVHDDARARGIDSNVRWRPGSIRNQFVNRHSRVETPRCAKRNDLKRSRMFFQHQGEHRCEIFFSNEGAGVRVAQNMCDLGRREVEVDRNENGTDFRECLGHHRKVEAVVSKQRHSVCGPDAQRQQGMGQSVRPLLELSIGERSLVVQKSYLVRKPSCVCGTEVANDGIVYFPFAWRSAS